MHSLVLLAAILLGQTPCQGNACLSPTLGPIPTFQQVAAPMLARYRIDHQGLDLTVEGWQFEARGPITWEPDRPSNAKALQAARAAKLAASRPKAPPVVGDDARAAQDAANEAAHRDYTDRLGIRHLWPGDSPPRQEPPIGQTSNAIPNYGIETQHLGYRSNHYSTPSEEGRRFVQEVKAADPEVDSIAGKLRVTIIGTEAERKRVLADLDAHPALSALKDTVLVQDYAPGEWAVDTSLGFQPGTPTILIQGGKTAKDPKGGEVLWRAKDYSGGPEKLAEEIRKANPSYQPELDPGIAPASSGSCPLGFTSRHYLPLALGVIALLWIFNPKKGPARA